MEQNITKESIETLLSQVSIITKKYDDIAKVTGENFNVFSILGLSTSEVKTHSRMLAELLNPSGSHAMEDIFLKLFIDNLISDDNIKNKYLTVTSKAKVLVEKRIGNIDYNEDTGGNIDIIIEFPSSEAIIIENKIHAGDQESQLRRYYNYNKKATLLYLTLDGKPAEENTTRNNDYQDSIIEPICLSYKESIVTWLELCKKEAVSHPLVRETITQYIYLIKRLTRQTMNEELAKELVNLIVNNAQNIRYAKKVVEVWRSCQYKILENLVNNDLMLFASNLGLLLEVDSRYNLGSEYSNFSLYRKDWCFCIKFRFDKELSVLRVGVNDISNDIKCPEELKNKLKDYLQDFNIGNRVYSPDWIWVTGIDKWDATSWDDIRDVMPEEFSMYTKALLEKLDNFMVHN